jgi:hypothetical protein
VPLERLAEAWVEAVGEDPADEGAAARFFERVARWVQGGLLAVRPPAAG